jgi:hypothetical protein
MTDMPTKAREAFDRDELAHRYARRHLDIDPGVVEIYYLPEHAPPREIRLLEVNKLIAGTTPLEPIDFGVDAGSPDGHSLVVLDVTPAQWKAVLNGRLELPAGWGLEGHQKVPPGRRRR